MDSNEIKQIADRILEHRPHWPRLRKEDPETAIMDLFELVIEDLTLTDDEESEILDFIHETY